ETSRPVTEYWLYMPERADGAAALEDFLVGNPAVSRDRVACRTPARQNG
ncbi:MAG TPA: SPOR domain-containing protein, partial [Alcanivorax sp.]|nr:SPOR domain-containing protein [Alcanivorax sp.]HBP67487.1 SPOR domain-containing protein [Alcanivorax sp.]